MRAVWVFEFGPKGEEHHLTGNLKSNVRLDIEMFIHHLYVTYLISLYLMKLCDRPPRG